MLSLDVAVGVVPHREMVNYRARWRTECESATAQSLPKRALNTREPSSNRIQQDAQSGVLSVLSTSLQKTQRHEKPAHLLRERSRHASLFEMRLLIRCRRLRHNRILSRVWFAFRPGPNSHRATRKTATERRRPKSKTLEWHANPVVIDFRCAAFQGFYRGPVSPSSWRRVRAWPDSASPKSDHWPGRGHTALHETFSAGCVGGAGHECGQIRLPEHPIMTL
jgi:hypothetical protein